MIIEFDWLSQEGIQSAINMIFKLIDIIRIVVPIGLIVMTSLDISKKVINPEDKDGQKKIMTRAIAALIVFLIPNFIDLFKGIANIGDSNIVIKPGDTPRPTVAPTIAPTVDPGTYLESLLLNNCPSEKTKYHKNDSITIRTDIPSSYTGSIKWSVDGDGKSLVSLHEIDGGKGVQVNVLDAKYSAKTAKIMVEAADRKNVCIITIQEDKLTSLKITNCPREQREYYVGDKITLNTDIPSDFTGAIKWKINDTKIAKIVGSSNQKSATIEILAEPETLAAFLTLNAGGLVETCYININAIKDLKITNCPPSTNIYHVGDKLTLKTNVPDTYLRSPTWTDTNSSVRVTPNQNGREALIEIIGIPSSNYIPIAVTAHAGRYTTICGLNVE